MLLTLIRMVKAFRDYQRNVSELSQLSDRELEVLRLMGDGHATRQIAEELHLSVKTVESYQAQPFKETRPMP